MALLVSIGHRDGSHTQMGFVTSPVRIGRNQLNEVHLEDQRVSQWHAIVRFDETTKEVTIMDLGSTNGTGFNGRLVQPRVPVLVTARDVLIVGAHEVTLTLAQLSRDQLTPLRVSTFDTGLHRVRTTMLGGAQANTPPPETKTSVKKLTRRKKSGVAAPPPASYNPPPSPPALPGEPCLPEIPTTVFQGRESRGRSQAPAPREEPFVQLVRGAVERSRPDYQAYRHAWGELFQQLRLILAEAPEPFREHVAIALKSACPQVAKEPEFCHLLRELGIASVVDDEVDPSEWLHRLKHGGRGGQQETVRLRPAMERVGAVIETFAEAFVALRRGYEQFSDELGLGVSQDPTPVASARDVRAVVQTLLDWNADGNQVIDDLKRAFTDLAMHQVALVHGVVEGVRAILEKLSPGVLSGKPASATLGDAPPPRRSMFSFLRARNAGSLWRAYVRAHQKLVEEDRFAREVFGQAFARGYFNVTAPRPHNEEQPPRRKPGLHKTRAVPPT